MATLQSSSEAARLIDGKAVAAAVRAQVSVDLAAMVADGSSSPGLATILIGDDPASRVYIAAKRKACAEVGITSFHHELPADVARSDVLRLIDKLNANPAVSGILCQLPLPGHLDPDEVTNRISSAKDVDGLTIANAGRLALGLAGLRPCTPVGVMVLLESYAVALAGKHAVVIGRSNLFGKPMASLLLGAHATVTVCHSRTVGLPDICRQAEVLVAAAGRAEFVRGDWVKPGAVVIDVGINRTDSGIVGDVAFDEAAEVASSITPVPGGVGPMTLACLMRNTVLAACDAVVDR